MSHRYLLAFKTFSAVSFNLREKAIAIVSDLSSYHTQLIFQVMDSEWLRYREQPVKTHDRKRKLMGLMEDCGL
jgi:hypothetical protein